MIATAVVTVTATIASSLTLTIDDGYALVESNEPDAIVLYDARPLPLNELVCLADPARDDGLWITPKRLA